MWHAEGRDLKMCVMMIKYIHRFFNISIPVMAKLACQPDWLYIQLRDPHRWVCFQEGWTEQGDLLTEWAVHCSDHEGRQVVQEEYIFILLVLFLQWTLRQPPNKWSGAKHGSTYLCCLWGKLRQETLEFETSLSYIVSPLIPTNK